MPKEQVTVKLDTVNHS